jgi:hypothetical protein
MSKRPSTAVSGASTLATSPPNGSAAKKQKTRGANATLEDKTLFLRLLSYHDKKKVLFGTSRNDKAKEEKNIIWAKMIR